jgi:peptidoglycan/LPS O-acetylase OafA/YrhL
VNRFNPLPFLAGAVLLVLAIFEDQFSTTFTYVLGMAIVSVLVSTMLIQFVFLGAVRGWRWLDNPLFRFFGKISYSLYLYHIIVIANVQYFLPTLRTRYSFPLIWVGSAAAAYASYVIIEKPFLRLKDRFAVVPAPENARKHKEPAKPQMAGVS